MADRFCVRCGEPGPFRSDLAMKCVNCDEKTADNRKTYHREYHRARGQAVNELIARHEAEYERLLIKARSEIEAEREAANKRPRKRASR